METIGEINTVGLDTRGLFVCSVRHHPGGKLTPGLMLLTGVAMIASSAVRKEWPQSRDRSRNNDETCLRTALLSTTLKFFPPGIRT